MCYSFKTSMVSYTLGLLSGIVALCTNQIILGCLILCYSQMQLSEALIWRGIDTNDTRLNQWGTRFGKYVLPMHNIAIAIGIILVALQTRRRPTMTSTRALCRTWAPLGIAIVFYIGILYHYHRSPSAKETYPLHRCAERSCQNSLNRLQWPYPTGWYTWSSVLSFLFLAVYVEPMSSKLCIGLFFLLTWLMALVVFQMTVSSIWCFFTAILAPLVVLVNYYCSRRDS